MLESLALQAAWKAIGAVSGWPTGRGRTAEETLARMAVPVNEELTDMRVRELAASIVAGVDGKDYAGQARALMRWLRVHTRFIRDPDTLELLQTPTYMLLKMQRSRDGVAAGDCDDLAMLSAVLAKQIGFAPWFIAEGYQAGPMAPLEHVFTVIETPLGWVALDTQLPPDSPPRLFARRIIREV